MCIHGHVHAKTDPASASVASAATARAYWVGNVQLPPLCSARPSLSPGTTVRQQGTTDVRQMYDSTTAYDSTAVRQLRQLYDSDHVWAMLSWSRVRTVRQPLVRVPGTYRTAAAAAAAGRRSCGGRRAPPAAVGGPAGGGAAGMDVTNG